MIQMLTILTYAGLQTGVRLEHCNLDGREVGKEVQKKKAEGEALHVDW